MISRWLDDILRRTQELDEPFKRGAQGTYIVVVGVDVDEIEMKLGELEINLGQGRLTKSITAGLITT